MSLSRLASALPTVPCPVCGKPVSVGSNACANCGANPSGTELLVTSSIRPVRRPRRGRAPAFGYIMTGLLVVLAAILVAGNQPVVVDRVPLLAIVHEAVYSFSQHAWVWGTAIIDRVGR